MPRFRYIGKDGHRDCESNTPFISIGYLGYGMSRGGEWLELCELAGEWEERFGESLGIGFEITPENIPLVRECLEKGNREPMEAYIRELVDSGIIC